MGNEKRGVAKAAKILKDSPDRWFRLVMLLWGNPSISQREAGIAAGFAAKQASSQVSRLLKNPLIRKAQAALKEGALDDASFDRAEWYRMQTKVARICVQEEAIDCENFVEGEDGEMVRSVEKSKIFDPAGANKALDNLAKAEGFYKDVKVDLGQIVFKQDLGSDDE